MVFWPYKAEEREDAPRRLCFSRPSCARRSTARTITYSPSIPRLGDMMPQNHYLAIPVLQLSVRSWRCCRRRWREEWHATEPSQMTGHATAIPLCLCLETGTRSISKRTDSSRRPIQTPEKRERVHPQTPPASIAEKQCNQSGGRSLRSWRRAQPISRFCQSP